MRKKICVLLGLCMLTTSTSVNAQVEDSTAVIKTLAVTSGVNTEGEATKGNLEKVVVAIKAKITIPKGLTDFEYDYNLNGYDSSPTWNLIWSNKDNSKRISITCDEKANIINYYNESDRENGKYNPKHLKSELRDSANKFIKKIAPSIYSHLKYVENQSGSIYSGCYTYSFERIENGISMPDNGVTIMINYETAQVVAANLSWLYDVKIPDTHSVISSQKAAVLIGNQMKMILSYENAYDMEESEKETIRTFLAYAPDKSYLSVDAKTGKIYSSRYEWLEEGKNEGSTNDQSVAGESNGKKDESSLTEAEIKKIKELEGLIDKTKAINIIKNEKSLLLENSLSVVTANLSNTAINSQDKKSSYVWNISFSKPISKSEESGDSYRPYANASVDAKTGKIISFRGSVRNYYDISEEKWESIKVNYSKNEALTIAENFLKNQIPDRLNQSRISKSENGYIIAFKEDQPVYGGYDFNYVRINENIEYAYNGINAKVDGVTGKIYHYTSNWSDSITFQSPKGAITQSEAFKKYIALEGYGLVYEINQIETVSTKDNTYSNKKEVRLVYRADIYPSRISPFTGKQLDENGENFTSKKGTYSYTDISSHKFQRSILLLADLGIGFDSSKFLPNNKIKAGEIESLLININNNAKGLTEQQKRNRVTRMDMIKRCIKVIELEKVAQIKGIYSVDFEDKKSIAKADIGYVALAKGLNIVSGKKLNPNKEMTRAEAADMIVNLLIGQSGLRN